MRSFIQWKIVQYCFLHHFIILFFEAFSNMKFFINALCCDHYFFKLTPKCTSFEIIRSDCVELRKDHSFVTSGKYQKESPIRIDLPY